MNKYLQDDVALIRQHEINPAPQYAVRFDMSCIGTGEVVLFITPEYGDVVTRSTDNDSVVAILDSLAKAFAVRDEEQSYYDHDEPEAPQPNVVHITHLLNQAV